MVDPEILIFDDDSVVGLLTVEALQSAGYQAKLFGNGTRVVSLVQEIKPRLVVLDIMMPGVDGLSLCKMLRELPDSRELRIVVVSGKTVGPVEQQARGAGADQFLRKPFSVADLLVHVRSLIGEPRKISREEAEVPISATILGSRSSRDTSSVALEIGDLLLLLDAGSGLRRLGKLAENRKKLRLFLTHYHPDHMEGLPSLPNVQLSVCGPRDVAVEPLPLIEKCLDTQARPRAKTAFTAIGEGDFDVAWGVKMSALYVNHPGTTLALRFEAFGKTLVYCPDNEVRAPAPGQMRDIEDKLKAFSRGADLLIHDARYSREDYGKRVNQGHSAFDAVVDLAVDAGVRSLLLFHLDSGYSDEQLKSLEAAARAHAESQITSLEVALAREGLRVRI